MNFIDIPLHITVIRKDSITNITFEWLFLYELMQHVDLFYPFVSSCIHMLHLTGFFPS